MSSKKYVSHHRLEKLNSADQILSKQHKFRGEGRAFRQSSDGMLLKKRKASTMSTMSRKSFCGSKYINPEMFNTVDDNQGRPLNMDYFYHHTDQEVEVDDEDLNNNEEEREEDIECKYVKSEKEGRRMFGGGELLPFWRSALVILAPALLSPILSIGTSEANCGFVILLMASYWVTEVIPLPVTALLPVILFPLLGIMSTDDVCIKYLKESNMMFFGGLIVAITVEHCRLHQRIALRVLLAIGTSPRLLMLGFMLPTMFLSMWISNTATTAMMVPIVEAVLAEINNVNEDSALETIQEDEEVHDKQKPPTTKTEATKKARKIRVMIYLSVAYAANCGGTGTLTGTGPNLVLKGMLGTLFHGSTPINFASWMGFAVPIMLVNLLLTWAWLQIFFMGVPWGKNKMDIGDKKSLRRVLREKYEDLGAMNFHQRAVLFFFSVLILLWFFRDPQFIPGWGPFFTEEVLNVCGVAKHHQLIDDASPAILIVLFLFVFPSKLSFWPFVPLKESRPAPALIDWRTIQDRFPWGVMILFGGGFALADGSKESGLSDWVGEQLTVLDSMPQGLFVLVICIMTGAVTEVTSNVATANILLPVLAELARSTNTNPLYFMVPATVTCSFAFMLPVATPPNAIVFSASGMRTSEMMAAGAVLNVLCIGVAVAAVNTYGVAMFNLNTFPEWAQTVTLASCNATQH